MAKFELKLPKMGESVAEATITSWLKEVGDTVELDEAIVEIATDKVDSEVPSEVEGTLVEILFEKDAESAKDLTNRGDGKDYEVSFVLEETQNRQEYKTFMWITIFTVAFGLLLIIFLKKLKKLTHGAEDNEGTNHEEAEGFELANTEG